MTRVFVGACVAVGVVVVAAGCLADRTLPGDVGARTPCHTNADCPASFVCPSAAAGTSSCVSRDRKACGNGVKDPGEECDDGNLKDGDGCRSDCTIERCGDGIVDEGIGEVCDDGNTKSGDGCSADCRKLEKCGDGVVDVGEECDLGAANADTGACTSTCKNAKCGDGFVRAGVEACDDGNTTSGDGCTADCTKIEKCGDGVVDVGEACDDGNTTSGDGCRGDCAKVEVCGDGVTDANEVCDDGNTTSGDGCRGDCQKIERCGDGIVDANEQCDDGNANDNDGCDATCAKTTWSVDVVTGLGVGGGAPLAIDLPDPLVAVDRLGRVFVSDGAAKIYRIDHTASGDRAVVVAGTGTQGFSGDGGPATGAQLAAPRGFSVDNAGRLFIAEAGNARIRRVDADGTITTIAGNGTAGFAGDGGPAVVAELNSPFDAVVDSKGEVFIADLNNCALRKIDATGIITTVKGGDCTAANAVPSFFDLDVDAQDRVLIAEGPGHPVERFDGTTFTALTGTTGLFVDGGVATQMNFQNVRGVAAHGDDVYLALVNKARVVRIDAQGIAHVVAGNGTIGFAGDGGDALQAELDIPSRVALDQAGNLFEAEIGNHDVRTIDATTGVITSIAGAPPHANLGAPVVVTAAVDNVGRVLWGDQAGFIARVESDGSLSLVGGNGIPADSGDGGPATLGGFRQVQTLVVDGGGDVLVAEAFTGRLRRIDQNGTLSTIAGNGGFLHTSDGALAAGNGMIPTAVALDGAGRVVVFDDTLATIRRIESDGTLTTLVGDDAGAGFVDDVAGRAAEMGDNVFAIAVAPNGDVLFGDVDHNRLRRWSAAADHVTTIAGDGSEASTYVEGALATATGVGGVDGVAFDGEGRVLFCSGDNARVMRIESDGTVHSILGDGTRAESGDGGPVSGAHTLGCSALTPLGGDDYVFATEVGTARTVRNGVVDTVVGNTPPAGVGPTSSGALASPNAFVAVDASTLLVASGAIGVLERVRLDQNAIDVAVAGTVGGFPIGADPFPVDVGASPPESRARFVRNFDDACGIAWDDAASFAYVADRGAGDVVRVRVPPSTRADPSTWSVSIAAGADADRRHVDGSDAATTRFVGPCGLALDPTGATLFIADADDDTVRRLDLTTGASSTLFGVSGAPGNLDDLLSGPTAVALDPAGDALFVADTDNHRVRRLALDASGLVVTGVVDVIGTGEAASSGDGAPANVFPVESPRGLAFDSFGDLLTTSTRTVRLVTPNHAGVVDGSGAVLTLYGAVPRNTFPQDSTFCLAGLQVVSDDDLRVADRCQGYLLELRRTRSP